MKYWKKPCQEQSSTSSKMDWITSDCLKRPCLPCQQRAHCTVWHIVIILLLVYKNMAMPQICPDKSCYDSAIFCPLYLILKYRETIFTLCFYRLATSGLSYSIQLYSWWGYEGLCSCLRKQDSLLHVWYPSYQDMHEPLLFLPLLKLRKKKWWDRWMQYRCSKGHEIKCCGTFAKSG